MQGMRTGQDGAYSQWKSIRITVSLYGGFSAGGSTGPEFGGPTARHSSAFPIPRSSQTAIGDSAPRRQAAAIAPTRTAAPPSPHPVPGTASLVTGQLIQRGPPRPRPSSLPGIVITSIPRLRRKVLVVTFRS